MPRHLADRYVDGGADRLRAPPSAVVARITARARRAGFTRFASTPARCWQPSVHGSGDAVGQRMFTSVATVPLVRSALRGVRTVAGSKQGWRRDCATDLHARVLRAHARARVGSWWNAAMRDIAGMLLDRCPASASRDDSRRRVRLGPNAVLVQPSLRRLAYARMRYLERCGDRGHAVGFEITQASALALPYPSASADVVVSLDVLQHVPLDGGDLPRSARCAGCSNRWLVLRSGRMRKAFRRHPMITQSSFIATSRASCTTSSRSSGFVVRRLSRVNALLGLAEIPRELRARRVQSADYHGILATNIGNGSWSVGRQASVGSARGTGGASWR